MDFLQTVAYSIALESDLEERIAHGALEQQIVGHRTNPEVNVNCKDDQRTTIATNAVTGLKCCEWVILAFVRADR